MRILPVIDLLDGYVVRGIGGRRAAYKPIASQIAADARPATVANAFRTLGYEEAYVADLNAIAGDDPAWDHYETIAAAGMKLWLDPGLSTPRRAELLCSRQFAGQPLPRIVVGLETLTSARLLRQCAESIGLDRLVFSLDLKQGHPLTSISQWQNHSPLTIAEIVLGMGIRHLIVLDLADVGEAAGTSTALLCRKIRALDANIELIAGGGVRHQADLDALATAGCNAALVASALHDGL